MDTQNVHQYIQTLDLGFPIKKISETAKSITAESLTRHWLARRQAEPIFAEDPIATFIIHKHGYECGSINNIDPKHWLAPEINNLVAAMLKPDDKFFFIGLYTPEATIPTDAITELGLQFQSAGRRNKVTMGDFILYNEYQLFSFDSWVKTLIREAQKKAGLVSNFS